MPEELPRTIAIFDVSDVREQTSTDAHGKQRVQRGVAKEKVTQIVETSIDVMSKNMEKFVGGMTEVLSSGTKLAGDFEINTVEAECFISSSGQIGLVGTGFELQGGSTLKIIFTKRKDNDNV